MTITFWTLSKRKNSTKQPAITGTDYTGTLTTESGMVSPSVIMDFGQTAPTYNYAYITEFGRYYWINEITSIGGGLWRVDMSCDVLASFKTAIGSASKYILRCASESDGDIVDTKYPTKAGYTFNHDSDTPGLAGFPLGTYIVGVITPGAGSNTFGSVQVFALTMAEMQQVKDALAPATYYSSINDTDLKNLAISVVNPMQYIAWVKYYPFLLDLSTATQATMQLGNLPALGPYSLLPTNAYEDSGDLDLHAHPASATRGNYLSAEPFSMRFISWFPIGTIHLPNTIRYDSGETGVNANKINWAFTVDLISGTADFRLYKVTSEILYRTAFTIGIDVPVAQVVSENPLKIISGAISIISSGFQAMAGNAIGAVGSGISAIKDFMTAGIGEVQAYKPGGGLSLVDPEINLLEVFANLVDEDNLEFGRPLCKVRSISLLSGYIQCAEGDIYAVGATAGELDEIAGYLTGGFYYE